MFSKPKRVSDFKIESKYQLNFKITSGRNELLSRWAGEGHLQPELMGSRQPAVQVVGCVGQTEVDHGSPGASAPAAKGVL